MSKGEHEYGPTWQDVYEYIHRLEGEYDKTIWLQMRLFETGKPPRLVGSAQAHAVRPDRPTEKAGAVGVAAFKGQGGYTTAPAAYWHALLDLELKLGGARGLAEQRSMF